jgi:hypothetical protein
LSVARLQQRRFGRSPGCFIAMQSRFMTDVFPQGGLFRFESFASWPGRRVGRILGTCVRSGAGKCSGWTSARLAKSRWILWECRFRRRIWSAARKRRFDIGGNRCGGASPTRSVENLRLSSAPQRRATTPSAAVDAQERYERRLKAGLSRRTPKISMTRGPGFDMLATCPMPLSAGRM